MKSFERFNDQSAGQEAGPEMRVRLELLEAEKYFDYLINVLPRKTAKQARNSEEYRQVLEKAAEVAEQLKQFRKSMGQED